MRTPTQMVSAVGAAGLSELRLVLALPARESMPCPATSAELPICRVKDQLNHTFRAQPSHRQAQAPQANKIEDFLAAVLVFETKINNAQFYHL